MRSTACCERSLVQGNTRLFACSHSARAAKLHTCLWRRRDFLPTVYTNFHKARLSADLPTLIVFSDRKSENTNSTCVIQSMPQVLLERLTLTDFWWRLSTIKNARTYLKQIACRDFVLTCNKRHILYYALCFHWYQYSKYEWTPRNYEWKRRCPPIELIVSKPFCPNPAIFRDERLDHKKNLVKYC